MCAWHVPAYAEAQCCFKSFALRSCQCGRKTRYGLEFWSLDLPSARVIFLGRVPALEIMMNLLVIFESIVCPDGTCQGDFQAWMALSKASMNVANIDYFINLQAHYNKFFLNAGLSKLSGCFLGGIDMNGIIEPHLLCHITMVNVNNINNLKNLWSENADQFL